MKSTFYKKGSVIKSFFQPTADQDEWHIRGTKKECMDFCKEKNLRFISIHKVTGSGAPYDEWYGIASGAE